MKTNIVNIIGGGYAGCEAALTLSEYGVEVHLFDIFSPNQNQIQTNVYTKRLHQELVALGSPSCRLVDDNLTNLRQKLRENVEKNANIKLFNGKIGEISLNEPTIIATGSNTSDEFFLQIENIVGKNRAYRWQPIFPVFKQLKLTQQGEYYYLAISHEQIKQAQLFLQNFPSKEECIEKWASSGVELLKAKCFKPGFIDGKIVPTCLKFKKIESGMLLQNFQTQLSPQDQQKLFDIIGLKGAQVVEYGSLKKCTFISPASCINAHLQSQNNPNIFFVGRLILVGGELEAVATGFLAALNILNMIEGRRLVRFPHGTMCANIIDKLFSLDGFKQLQIDLDCDIIKNVDQNSAIKKLASFKEDFDARISWYNNLCSKKRW